MYVNIYNHINSPSDKCNFTKLKGSYQMEKRVWCIIIIKNSLFVALILPTYFFRVFECMGGVRQILINFYCNWGAIYVVFTPRLGRVPGLWGALGLFMYF